ncbi:MAG: riboflavin synthase [Bacteroidota bacterium]
MFTGIIETTGIITDIHESGSNLTFLISSPISDELKPDQSVAHDGVCLTVEEVNDEGYRVTAVAETLSKTTLATWEKGKSVNLERCLIMPARLDGHIVLGHVDAIGTCLSAEEIGGSWIFRIGYPAGFAALLVEKGSVSLNGISLTVFNVLENEFSVTVIPYTYSHTTMKWLLPGHKINLEFDILGKYVQRNLLIQQRP